MWDILHADSRIDLKMINDEITMRNLVTPFFINKKVSFLSC